MASSEDAETPFQVHAYAVVLKRLRQLQRRATREGRGDLFLAALRQIHRQLQTNPTAFGEPLYRLPALGLEVRNASIRPLVVNFAVSAERALVFVKGARLLTARGS